ADAGGLPTGTAVGTVGLERGGRTVGRFVLRAGAETGDWAAGRPDLRGRAAAGAAPIAWVAPEEAWFAQAYRSSWRAPAPARVDAVRVELAPDAAAAGVTLALRRVEVLR